MIDLFTTSCSHSWVLTQTGSKQLLCWLMFYGDCSACASACAAAECACAFDSQGLYRSEGGEGALGQGLDLVVVERQQREILQVLEGVGANAVDLIGVQQPGEEGKRTEEGDVKRRGKMEGSSLSEFLFGFIHYAFHQENCAQVQSLFQGHDFFTE